MDRPWVDARTYRPQIEMKKITAKEIIEAVEKMNEIPANGHYIFLTKWVKPYVSEEECIKFFADNCSVVVYDSNGCAWHKGEKIYMGMRMQLI